MGLNFAYGPGLAKQEAISLIRNAFASGVTFFDTPRHMDLHERGTGWRGTRTHPRPGCDSNEVCFKDGNPSAAMDSRPERIRQVADASLKRLKTDRIDLFYQHRVDTNVPMEDVAGTVKDLIREGKVKHFGLSEPAFSRSAVRTRCSP